MRKNILAPLASILATLVICPVISPAQNSSGGNGSLSRNAMDLCGLWKVEDQSSYSNRTFEFFPDGNVTETSTYKSSQGESIQSYKKVWKVIGDKILITQPGQNRSNESNVHKIFIEIPFDTNRLQIVETWDSRNSSRTTKMYGVRVGPPPAALRSSPEPDSAPPTHLSADELAKLSITVVPSKKTSREDYYTIQRLSLSISVKNPSLREATGPLTVSYWILGKSNGKNSRQFCVFTKGQFDCSLGTDSSTREFKTTTDQFQNKYYDSSFGSSSDSYEYTGWIVAVSDPSGKIANIKSTSSAWEREGAKLPFLESGRVYDLQLDKVEGAHYYNYSY